MKWYEPPLVRSSGSTGTNTISDARRTSQMSDLLFTLPAVRNGDASLTLIWSSLVPEANRFGSLPGPQGSVVVTKLSCNSGYVAAVLNQSPVELTCGFPSISNLVLTTIPVVAPTGAPVP